MSDPIPGLLPDPVLRCATCGTPLGDDPEDEPDGDAGLPICGECNRARNFDLRRAPAPCSTARGCAGTRARAE